MLETNVRIPSDSNEFIENICRDFTKCTVSAGVPVHNVYFVKYDVTVSFLVQVLDTVTYFVSHVFDSGYSDIFWHIL